MGFWKHNRGLISALGSAFCSIAGLTFGLGYDEWAKGAFFLIMAHWLERDYERWKAEARAALKGGQQ